MFKNIKILHIINDNKFIDSAYFSFEKVAPGCNDFIIPGERKKLKYIKYTPIKHINRFSYLNPFFHFRLKKYNFVVLHSLKTFDQRLIILANKKTKIVWTGFGYDYYDLIYKNKSEFIKEETEKIVNKLKKQKNEKYKKKNIKRNIINKIFSKTKAIKKIDYFAPVLKSEFKLVANNFDKQFPKYIDWNYSNIELFLKESNKNSINGNDILIGNSATPTNNHLEIFKILKKVNLKNRKIICPLSYGDESYGNYIEKKGKEMFGENFIPIRNFMLLDNYLELISSCSHVIMNHIRQQGGGNIKAMILLGAKVFLDPKNPFFEHYKKMGVKIYSIKEITPQSMNNFLDQNLIDNNQKVLQKEMKEKNSTFKTKNLIRELMDIENDSKKQSTI